MIKKLLTTKALKPATWLIAAATAGGLALGPVTWADDDDDDDSLWDSPGEEFVINDRLSVHLEDVMILYPETPPDTLPVWVYKQDGIPFAALAVNETGLAVAFVEAAYTPEELQLISEAPVFQELGAAPQTGTLILSSNAVRLNSLVMKSDGFDPGAFRHEEDDDDLEDDDHDEEEDYEEEEEEDDYEDEGEEEDDDYEDEDEDEEEDYEDEDEDDDDYENIKVKFADERIVEVRALILRDEANNVVGADVCGTDECCWLIVNGVLDPNELNEITDDGFIQQAKDQIDQVTMTLDDGTELPAIAFVEAVDFPTEDFAPGNGVSHGATGGGTEGAESGSEGDGEAGGDGDARHEEDDEEPYEDEEEEEPYEEDEEAYEDDEEEGYEDDDDEDDDEEDEDDDEDDEDDDEDDEDDDEEDEDDD